MLNQDMDDQSASWLSYHIYYFQDLDLAIQRLVRPLILKLLAADLVERFFFIRYRLGGPHIRLRLLAREGQADTVAAIVEAEANSFFLSCPSSSSLGVDEIRQNNKVLLASDPNEWEDSVYLDNSCLMMPFRPEIERYGGPVLLEASLDFFAVSSVATLELLNRYGESPRSRLLAVASQVLACQALSSYTTGLMPGENRSRARSPRRSVSSASSGTTLANSSNGSCGG
jgi:hypothetical protein